jgi:hypothetical protein
LDVGKAAYEQGFWDKIQKEFLVSKPEYDILQFQDDDTFFNESFNPGKIVTHDWRKLRYIWKAVNADYKQAFDRFTQSGTHENNFLAFCSGKKEAYYLRLHLGNKPSLNEMVEAELPEGCCVSSSTTINMSSCSKTSTKKRSIDNLADVINDSFDNTKLCDLAECKITFMATETQRKDCDFTLRFEEAKLQEWSMIRDNIKKLRTELAGETDLFEKKS